MENNHAKPNFMVWIKEENLVLFGEIGQNKIESLGLEIEGIDGFGVDSVVKTAFLITLAGYLEKDDILVNGEKYYSVDKLSEFFSYVLNDKRAAPRKFNVSLEFSPTRKIDSSKSKKTSKAEIVFVSFSGGLDSTAGTLYAIDKGYNVQPVWVGFGQKNEKRELKVVKRVCKKLNINPVLVRVDMKDYVDTGWNRWKMGIIPARNYLFASIAASMANKYTNKSSKIFICAHKGEITPTNTDKSLRFYSTSSDIFSRAYGKNISVTTPFSRVTKAEIISYWIKNWLDKYGISPEETVSCYYGEKCGNCKACINRAVAFSCNDLLIEDFKNNPFQDREEVIRKGYMKRFNSLKTDRKLDFLIAFNKNLTQLPEDLANFVKKKYGKNKEAVQERQAKIKGGRGIE